MRERVILIGLLFVVLLLVGCGGPSAESGPTDKCELANPPLFEGPAYGRHGQAGLPAVVHRKPQRLLGVRGRCSE